MARFAETRQRVIAIDDKSLRLSFDAATAKPALHMVSDWSYAQRLERFPIRWNHLIE